MQHGDTAPASRRSRRGAHHNQFEALESRCLLSAVVNKTDAFDISQIPVFRATSTDLADVKNGPLANAGSHLAYLYINYRHAIKSAADFVNNDSTIVVNGDKVGVTLRIRTDDLDRFVRGLTNAYDFEVTATSETYSVAQGYLPINWLRTVAARADIAQISPIYGTIKKQQGLAGNQGDLAENAATARTNFNLTGAGVKIGVLSDSANRSGLGLQQSITSGDLPNTVQIVKDGNSFGDADEGRAMMEEIHDIVPDASLAFATADGGQQAFANNIKLLASGGAKILVDDIGYLDEPMFQEGVVETAIRTVTATGAIYDTAIGNSGTSGIERNINFTKVNGVSLVNFGTQQTPLTRMTVEIQDGGTMTFEWDNPYNGITGAATADMDIRFYQSGTNNLKAESLDDNISSGRPVELFNVPKGLYDVVIDLPQLKTGATAPSRFKLVGEVGMKVVNVSGSTSSGFGHAVSDALISVGAVPFFNAPPFSSLTPIDNEDFSSQGGGTYVFDASGHRLAFPIVTQKPDISGIDGVNTSFFGQDIGVDGDNFPNFFGTSAAAPNVAAVIAMIKQANPTVTQDQIITGLKSTARPLNGTAQGVWDSVGGFGLIDADAAIPAFASKPAVAISAVTPDPRGTAVSTMTITFNQYITGFTRSDLSLRLNFGANLLTGSQSLTTTNHITWTLSGLTGITTANGVYRVVLNAAGAGVTNVVGGALTDNAVESWTKTDPPPLPAKVSTFVMAPVSSNAIQLNWHDNNNFEDEYVLQRSLDPDFGSQLRTYHLPKNSTSYLSTGLSAGTRYYYRIRASNTTGTGTYTAKQFALTRVGGEIVLDNNSPGVVVAGFWGSSTAGGDFVGEDYLQDGNSAKGTKLIRYDLPLQGSGEYYVYAHWTPGSNRATNTPFDVVFGANALQRTTILMDQRHRGGDGWTLIGGPFYFQQGSAASVRIRNAGTNGLVVADALRVLPAGPIVPAALHGVTSAMSMPSNDDSHRWDDLFSPPDNATV